jgi:hypothetical protein
MQSAVFAKLLVIDTFIPKMMSHHQGDAII